MKRELAVFEGHHIRRIYDEPTETWWFSVVDIIQVLTQQPNYKAAQNYWKVLKHRLNKEGSQLVTKCNQLKKPAWNSRQNPARRWSPAQITCLRLHLLSRSNERSRHPRRAH